MSKYTIIYIIVLFILFIFPSQVLAEPYINAQSSAVGDMKSGMLVYEKNANEKRPPASLTKMMTAIIAVEYGDLEQNVKVSLKAQRIPPSKLYIHVGEVIPLNSLLKAALMISANDACVAIAEHVGGEEDYFVYLMNLKGWAIGMDNTHFTNTNGLPAKEHYSSAEDLVRLGIYVKRNSVLKDYTSLKSTVITRMDREITLNNTNKLLWSYPGANGIKTGTTNAAGQCLASSAKVEGQEFVAVVLRAGDRYIATREALNYAFHNYASKKIHSRNQIDELTFGRKNLQIKVSSLEDYYIPYSDGLVIKKYLFYLNNNPILQKGEKCGILAVVTVDKVLWYDIFADEYSPKVTFFDNALSLLEDIQLMFK